MIFILDGVEESSSLKNKYTVDDYFNFHSFFFSLYFKLDTTL